MLLRLGVNARRLFTLAALLIAAVPVLYLVSPAHDFGGFDFGYSLHYLTAHWLAAGAVCLLLAGAIVQATGLRRLRRPRVARAVDHDEPLQPPGPAPDSPPVAPLPGHEG
jgi:hypothetical protein